MMFDLVLCTSVPHVSVVAVLTRAAEIYHVFKLHVSDICHLRANQMTLYGFPFDYCGKVFSPFSLINSAFNFYL